MQPSRFLHTLLTSLLPVVHAKRLQALLDAVSALLGERRLGLMALGRALPDARCRSSRRSITRIVVPTVKRTC